MEAVFVLGCFGESDLSRGARRSVCPIFNMEVSGDIEDRRSDDLARWVLFGVFIVYLQTVDAARHLPQPPSSPVHFSYTTERLVSRIQVKA